MLTALPQAALFTFCMLVAGDAFAQEPIRIDRPKEGDTVATEVEVAGVATPGSTVEIWVDRVFIVDALAEPDGWYVARIDRPPGATENSRIFAHELNPEGERTSSAVVRVIWSEQPVAEKPVAPPPPVAVELTPAEAEAVASLPPAETAAEVTEAPAPEPYVAGRSARVVVEYLLGATAGVIGATLGILVGNAIGQPDSGERAAGRFFFGSVAGGMAAAGTVYGVGAAMHGNGSFVWTAVGGLGGAVLISTVLLVTENGGLAYVPIAMAAFALPVIGYELTSDANRDAPAQPATAVPTVGLSKEGRATLGFAVRW